MRQLTTAAVTVALVLTFAAGQVFAVAFVPTAGVDLGRPGDDPVAVGSYSYDAGTDTYTVNGGGSDWWDWGERAHFAYAPVSGDFRIEADVTWINRTGDWAAMDNWVKAGLALRNDVDNGAGNEREVNYFMAHLKPPRTEVAYQGRPDNTSNSMFNVQMGGLSAQDNRLIALNRTNVDGWAYVEGFVHDGTNWVKVGGEYASNLLDDAFVGMAVTAHNNDGRLETATFGNVQIMDATPAIDPGRAPGGMVSDPEGVGPVQGGWGVLEVVNNGNMGSVGAGVASLESTTGDRLVYDLMGPININDSDPQANAKNIPGDGPYGVTNEHLAVGAPWPAPGTADHLAFLARGRVMIPTTGDWTFYINSDDGEELSIDNGALIIGSEGWQDNNFGTVHLTAGPHDIQVIHREATGGGDVEVAAAMGATTDLRAFTLIGSGDPGHDAYVDFKVPGTGDITIEMSVPDAHGNLGNLAQAMAAIEAGRTAQSNVVATDTKINFHDPEDGGTGSIGGDDPYLIDTAAADNHFALLANGAINIVEDGLYYFGFQSDDGARLTIPGQEWIEIVEVAEEGVSFIDETDPSILYRDNGTGNSRTVASIQLTAGSYPFEFLTWEGGGGAYCEVFGSDTQGKYGLLMTGDEFVSMAPAAAAALELVPEPSTWFMLLSIAVMGLFGLIRRRKA